MPRRNKLIAGKEKEPTKRYVEYGKTQIDELAMQFWLDRTDASRQALLAVVYDVVSLWYVNTIWTNDLRDEFANYMVHHVDRSLPGYVGPERAIKLWNPTLSTFFGWLQARTASRVVDFYRKQARSKAPVVVGGESFDIAIATTANQQLNPEQALLLQEAALNALADEVSEAALNDLADEVSAFEETEHDSTEPAKETDRSVDENQIASIVDAFGVEAHESNIDAGYQRTSDRQQHSWGARHDGTGYSGKGRRGASFTMTKSAQLRSFYIEGPRFFTTEEQARWDEDKRRGLPKPIRCWDKECPGRPANMEATVRAGGHLFITGKNLPEDMGRYCPICLDSHMLVIEEQQQRLQMKVIAAGVSIKEPRKLVAELKWNKRKLRKVAQAVKKTRVSAKMKRTQAALSLGDKLIAAGFKASE